MRSLSFIRDEMSLLRPCYELALKNCQCFLVYLVKFISDVPAEHAFMHLIEIIQLLYQHVHVGLEEVDLEIGLAKGPKEFLPEVLDVRLVQLDVDELVEEVQMLLGDCLDMRLNGLRSVYLSEKPSKHVFEQSLLVR